MNLIVSKLRTPTNLLKMKYSLILFTQGFACMCYILSILEMYIFVVSHLVSMKVQTKFCGIWFALGYKYPNEINCLQ